jgi:hypothetical protein
MSGPVDGPQGLRKRQPSKKVFDSHCPTVMYSGLHINRMRKLRGKQAIVSPASVVLPGSLSLLRGRGGLRSRVV